MDFTIVNSHIAYWGEHFKIPLLTLDEEGLPIIGDCVRIEGAVSYFNYIFNHKEEALALALCFIDYARQSNPALSGTSVGDFSESYITNKGEEGNPFYTPLVKLGVIKANNEAWVAVC